MTGGYKGLQGVTRGDRGLQGLTGGYKGLQGVTKDYRNFFLTRTFPDTFSCSILYKKSNLKKSQIFDQKDGLTPLEKFLFCVFHKQLFLKSLKAAFLSRTSANTFSWSVFDKHKR